MKEEFIKQAFAELIAANEAALGIVVAAIAKQTDAERLLEDLKTQIQAARLDRTVPPMAIRQATVAQAAVEAETLLRRSHAAKH